MGLLDHKTAVVTGANSGIGLLSSFITGSTIDADGGFNQV